MTAHVCRASLALVLATACAHTRPSTAVLEEASARALAGRATPRDLALSTLQALLMSREPARARVRLDTAMSRAGEDPFTWYAALLMATRAADPTARLEAALSLCERAPRHPLSAVGARVVMSTAGLSADEEAALLADLGIATRATLVGPLSPWHRLGLVTPTEAERRGVVDGLSGPTGAAPPRQLSFADGHFALSGEPRDLDVYVLAMDVTVPAGGQAWVLRTVTSLDHVVVVDGTTVLSRLTWERPASTIQTAVLALPAGNHRVMVRLAREDMAGHLVLALQPLDGSPAGLRFAPAQGVAPRWGGKVEVRRAAPGLYPSAASLHAALAPEAGDALARFIAAMDAVERDADGAAELVDALPDTVASPLARWLRAQVALADRSVTARVARGRATRELEAALGQDPGLVAARVDRARLAVEDGRELDAVEELSSLERTGPVAPVDLMLARARLALGLDAAAAAAVAPLREQGHCEAALLEYELARRRDAVAHADAALERARHCAGDLARRADHLRGRGDLAGAEAAYRALLDRDVTRLEVGLSLAGTLSAQRRFDDAVAVLDRQLALWPRAVQLWRGKADILEQAGLLPQALAAREAALALDGSDLTLRRMVERARTGQEPLAEEAISTEEALRSYQAATGSEDATSAFVLDFAAIRAYPDGSMVDRVHIIQKALDQQGVSEIAEVALPPGAQVLTLRTLKPDGRTLDPESIEGKETVSLPGVQVGDLVEYEYLLAHPARGPAAPGFTASNFYFQIARQPNARSTYVVKAPKGTGLGVDAHNVTAPPVRVEGELEVFRHEERRVPPYIPEPQGPPSGTEWLPFVSVGAGATGQEPLLTSYADAFVDRGQVTFAVRRFAGEAAGNATGRAAVERVYRAVMDRLSGPDLGLTVSASASVAQDRGSRTWLLYAALKALGFPVRLAAVRTFTADPAPYRYPADGLFNYVCVVVEAGKGQRLWLDPAVRHAPFAELPEAALGAREAVLLPEPGSPLEPITTPPRAERPGKHITLTMALGADGVLEGDVEERYVGFEAATVTEALDALSVDQRDQALQTALSRYFGGADLSGLEVQTEKEKDVSLVLRFHFVSRAFARVDRSTGKLRLVAPALTYPHRLGQRFVALAGRTTPLFIEATEAATVRATVTLPPGVVLRSPVEGAVVTGPESPEGTARFARDEVQEGPTLTITEDYRLPQARIAPADYPAFARFAGEVDLLQQRDLLLEEP